MFSPENPGHRVGVRHAVRSHPRSAEGERWRSRHETSCMSRRCPGPWTTGLTETRSRNAEWPRRAKVGRAYWLPVPMPLRPPLDHQADGSYGYVASWHFASQRTGDGRHGLSAGAIGDGDMRGPALRGPGDVTRSSCHRECGLSYSVVDGIEGTLGGEAQHDRLRVVQDSGNRDADRLYRGEVLPRRGKHLVEVSARDIVRGARD